MRLMYDNLQETQANKGESNKYNLTQPMQLIKERCNKDNQIETTFVGKKLYYCINENENILQPNVS
jgi:hypothetical protein